MIEYELVRSKRKTLAVQVTREGRVIVRAPLRLAKYRIERFVAEHTDWIARALADQQSRRAAHPEPDEAKQAELIRRAKIELPSKVQHYAKLMNLYPTGLKITSARTRFGSCSGKNSTIPNPLSTMWWCMNWRTLHIKTMDRSSGRWWSAIYPIIVRGVPCCANENRKRV